MRNVLDIKLVLINGPKRSGKSTNADLLADMLRQSNSFAGKVHRFNMADHLKIIGNTIYNVMSEDGTVAPPDFTESFKDMELDEFGGESFRQLIIDISERYLKKRHGHTVFGKWLGDKIRINCNPGDMVIIGDSGFASEIVPLINMVGPENAILYRMRREGKTFDGDSRSYIYWKDILSYRDRTRPKLRIGEPRLTNEIRQWAHDLNDILPEYDIQNVEDDVMISATEIRRHLDDMGWMTQAEIDQNPEFEMSI